MERIDSFEKMLQDVQSHSQAEKKTLDGLKAQGKEKTATYRQYLGNRLVYNEILSLYKQYGLIE